MKKLLLTLLIVLGTAGVTILALRFLLGGPEDTWTCQNGEWIEHGKPRMEKPVEECLPDEFMELEAGEYDTEEGNADEGLIGGDTDEYGCLIAAGFSWCEAKSECIRVWEESCESNENGEDVEGAQSVEDIESEPETVTVTNENTVEEIE